MIPVKIYTPGTKGKWNIDLRSENLVAKTIYKVGVGLYETDEKCRVVQCESPLVLRKQARNGYQQKKAAKLGRRVGGIYQGGHLFACSLGGSGDPINLIPMRRNLNLGGWKKYENIWRKKLQEGRSVYVRIELEYSDKHIRCPTTISISFSINNGPFTSPQKFDN